ncbi:MAG: dephospho-CoA kinase [Candidatus Korobacteraceae bacterium]
MLRVGLTGGIACGKSSIAAMLVKRGAHFLQADGLAHQLYAPGTATYDKVVHSFGREILNEDGAINRSKLADLVFPRRIGELNAIVHPEVVKRQNSWMSEVEQSDPHGIAVVEAALLIEAGANKDFDKVIVVTCGFEQKVERFARRTNVPLEVARAEVERRSAAQFSDEEKAQRADYIVDNSGSAEDTERQVDLIWRELQRLASTGN